MGHLTRDPEIRVTPKGTSICQFGLAINRSFKGEDGQTRDDVTFVDLEAWGKTAETIAKYCTKGKPLFVEGRLKLDRRDDKTTGQKRSKIKVVVENFQFIGGKDDGATGGQQEQHQEPTPPANPAPRPPAPPAGIDEDVPF